MLKADKRRYKQAIFNLLSNAIKYTNLGGEISVKVDQNGVKVSNEFEGDPPKPSDFGTGLKSVRDFCEHHNFGFEISKVGKYVVAEIIYNAK